jgi:hypothetical protein
LSQPTRFVSVVATDEQDTSARTACHTTRESLSPHPGVRRFTEIGAGRVSRVLGAGRVSRVLGTGADDDGGGVMDGVVDSVGAGVVPEGEVAERGGWGCHGKAKPGLI